MKRKIVEIDEAKCTGCGLCANACHEGAIAMVDGKAKLVKDDYCDGMGDCLTEDGEDAGTDEVRRNGSASGGTYAAARRLPRQGDAPVQPRRCATSDTARQLSTHNSKLSTIPVAVPDSACAGQGSVLPRRETAHRRRLHGLRIRTLVGCPKLDPVDYSEKLTEILRENDIKSVTIVRMEVPCCGGLEMAAKKALQASGKFIPWQVVTISLDGRIIDS